MNNRVIVLLAASVFSGAIATYGAAPGPQSRFGNNIVWDHPDVNAVNVDGSVTRGILYFDMANEVGAVDRLTEAISNDLVNSAKSNYDISEINRVLAIAKVLSSSSEPLRIVGEWISANPSSPYRTDMLLLEANLLLEEGSYSEAYDNYLHIDVDALNPLLRSDYLYHIALCELFLGVYDEAEADFSVNELLQSKTYGNAARFYQGYLKYINRDYKGALTYWENVNPYTNPGRMADYYRAQIAYYDGHYNEALRLARSVVNESEAPKLFSAEANRIIGESLYQTGDTSQSIKYLKRYVSEVETPERSTLYILGLAQYSDGEYSDAISSLTPVTSDVSAMGQSAYLYIGQAMLKLGNSDGAIMAFNRALSMNIDKDVTEAAYYNYAVAKSRGGSVPFASSVTVFEDFLNRYPNSRYADDVAGYIVAGYVTDGNYEDALKSINRVSQPGHNLLAAKQRVLYLLGSKMLAADNPERTVELLSEGRLLGNYDQNLNIENTLALGEAFYRSGDFDRSASMLLEYLDQAPRDAVNRPIALYDLGYTRMAQEEWGKAQLDFERMLANPGDLTEITLADAYTRLGDARYYQRDWNGAQDAYDSAFRLYPSGGDYPLFQKAVMLGYTGRNKEKTTVIDTLLKEFPTSPLIPSAYIEQAETYVLLKQNAKANEVYNELIEKYSETVQGRQAYLYLAAAEAGSGNSDEAISLYESLIVFAPSSSEAQEANEMLKQLHADRGTLRHYNQFITSIQGMTPMDASETEQLAWSAAERAYIEGKGVVMLEQFVGEYSDGQYTPRALGYLFENAVSKGNDADSYKWASKLVAQYPDFASSEDAMIIKGEIEYERGRGVDALQTWELLEQKASTPENRNVARMGIMRVARDMGDATRMLSSSEALLRSTALGTEQKTEAAFTRALALNIEGNTEDAIAGWKEIIANTGDEYGAKAAVYVGETLNKQGKYDEAAEISEAFVKSNTPFADSLARGYINLSDSYAGLGRDFESQEILKLLKDNYPGTSPDILFMIEERLK